jgi:hypothetical protein
MEYRGGVLHKSLETPNGQGCQPGLHYSGYNWNYCFENVELEQEVCSPGLRCKMGKVVGIMELMSFLTSGFSLRSTYSSVYTVFVQSGNVGTIRIGEFQSINRLRRWNDIISLREHPSHNFFRFILNGRL